MMLAEEAHYMGEPCYHVVQYYERKRQARIAEKQARHARSYQFGTASFRNAIDVARHFGRVYK